MFDVKDAQWRVLFARVRGKNRSLQRYSLARAIDDCPGNGVFNRLSIF